MKDAIKHGFTSEMGGIKRITDFNGSSNLVDGLMDCEIRLGPGRETRKVEFLVTPNIIISILGCLAWTELDLTMDYRERILTDDQRNVVRCSAVQALKN